MIKPPFFFFFYLGGFFKGGGHVYIRRGAKELSDIIDLSETYTEEYESEW
jgi:hypothetical protein